MGSYRPGFSNNIDPKFDWCWRKEEKKWLCLKHVILNDKYSERHMNIGYYNSSRKSVERGTGETSRSSLGMKAAKVKDTLQIFLFLSSSSFCSCSPYQTSIVGPFVCCVDSRCGERVNRIFNFLQGETL